VLKTKSVKENFSNGPQKEKPNPHAFLFWKEMGHWQASERINEAWEKPEGIGAHRRIDIKESDNGNARHVDKNSLLFSILRDNIT